MCFTTFEQYSDHTDNCYKSVTLSVILHFLTVSSLVTGWHSFTHKEIMFYCRYYFLLYYKLYFNSNEWHKQLLHSFTEAFFTYKLWKISGESGSDIVQTYAFTHVVHSGSLSDSNRNCKVCRRHVTTELTFLHYPELVLLGNA